MRERAAAAGGRLTVRSAPGDGTLVRLELPDPGRAVMTRPITVLIADDHPVVRQGLQVLLSVTDDIDVVGEAADGAQVVAMAAELDPDVILLDLKLPVMDGVAVLNELRDAGLRARALVLTSAADRGLETLAVQAGAAGFLYKDVDPDALVRALRSVHDGHTLLAPEVAGALLRSGPIPGRTRHRRAHRPGARGAGADRPGPLEPGDSPAAAGVREDGQDPRQLRCWPSSACRTARRPRCWPSGSSTGRA